MQNNTILIVPDWVVQCVRLGQRNWLAFLGTVLLVTLIAVIVQLKKKKWNVTKEEEVAKKLVKRLIAVLGIVFGAAGSLAYFVSQNMPVLKNMPYVGEYIVTLYGALWAVYNFRLNKTFQKFEQPLAHWSGADKVTSVQTNTVSPQPQTADPNSFL